MSQPSVGLFDDPLTENAWCQTIIIALVNVYQYES